MNTRTVEQSLRDCYTMARRRIKALEKFDGAVVHDEREAWQHVIRFCENAGLEPDGVLRDPLRAGSSASE